MADHRYTFDALRRSKGSCERCGHNVGMRRLTCQNHGNGLQAICHSCNRKAKDKHRKKPKPKRKKQQKRVRWESYQQYLNSNTWKKKRKRKLHQVGYKCEICSGTDNLQVHHLTYERIFQEPLSDLQVLCGDNCHPTEHEDKGFFGVMSHEFMDIVAE